MGLLSFVKISLKISQKICKHKGHKDKTNTQEYFYTKKINNLKNNFVDGTF